MFGGFLGYHHTGGSWIFGVPCDLAKPSRFAATLQRAGSGGTHGPTIRAATCSCLADNHFHPPSEFWGSEVNVSNYFFATGPMIYYISTDILIIVYFYMRKSRCVWMYQTNSALKLERGPLSNAIVAQWMSRKWMETRISRNPSVYSFDGPDSSARICWPVLGVLLNCVHFDLWRGYLWHRTSHFYWSNCIL